ncbi:hypothetical protein [Micromonospora musae]|uniref:hypothetical protein n=1 Tax=Micromonospora musae TaxID=1894970 RepID=UPI0033E4B756
MIAVRRALEFLFTRVLRSRIGIAVALAVVVFGIIGAARLLSGPIDPSLGLSNRPTEPITTVDPHAGDDGLIAGEEPRDPVTRPGATKPEQIADRFVTAWLGKPGMTATEWREGMRPLSTPALITKMAEAAPETVPAREATDEATLQPRTETFVEVLVPMDTGRLRLELVAPEGEWLVDAVDWEQG